MINPCQWKSTAFIILTLARSELMLRAWFQSLFKEGSPGEAMLIILIASPELSRAKTDNEHESSVIRHAEKNILLTIILDLLAHLRFVLHWTCHLCSVMGM
jgi:hypothetical protein